jgi:hypothetical protein
MILEREPLQGGELRLQEEIRKRKSKHWLLHWIVE